MFKNSILGQTVLYHSIPCRSYWLSNIIACGYFSFSRLSSVLFVAVHFIIKSHFIMLNSVLTAQYLVRCDQNVRVSLFIKSELITVNIISY